MKYPKLWDGPSPVGEALSRALQKTDVPYLSATDGQGMWVYKKIGLIEVMKSTTDAEVEHMGWFCVGYEDGRGTTNFTVMGSSTGSGTFKRVGEVSNPAFWQNPLKRYSNFAAQHLGFGWMTLPDTASPPPESGGTFTRISRNGRSTQDFLLAESGQTLFSPSQIVRIGYYLLLGKSTIFGESFGARRLLARVTTRASLDGDTITSSPAVIFSEKRSGVWDTHTLTTAIGEAWGVSPPQALDANTAFVCCFRTLQLDKYKYSGDTTYDNNFDPTQQALMKVSVGPTLETVDAGELFDFYHPPVVEAFCEYKYDGFNPAEPLRAESEWLWRYNTFYISDATIGIRFGRLDDGSVVALNSAWRYDRRYIPDEISDWDLAYYDSANLVPRDSATHETAESLASFGKVAVFLGTGNGGFTRIDDLAHSGKFGYIFHPVTVGKFTVFQLTPHSAWWDFPGESGDVCAIAVFTTNGGTGFEVNVYDLPFPPHCCGELTAIDETTLGLMAYGENEEGQTGYHFYETKIVEDGQPFGSEWAWRATVNDRADPPAQYGASESTLAFNPAVARDRKVLPYMDNFNRVVHLRENDHPASMTPGAPWLSNANKQKPWE